MHSELDSQQQPVALRRTCSEHPCCNEPLKLGALFVAVFMILLLTVCQDLTKYEELDKEACAQMNEWSGWKLVVGDVFTPTSNSKLFVYWLGMDFRNLGSQSWLFYLLLVLYWASFSLGRTPFFFWVSSILSWRHISLSTYGYGALKHHHN